MINRWFLGMFLVGALVAGAATLSASAQPAPAGTASPSPTPMSTMQPR